MRFVLIPLLLCGLLAAQQPGLTAFLGLTAQQVNSVLELNNAFVQFTKAKTDRMNAVQSELAAEYAKVSPNPQALGQRYIEIDSINHELAAQRVDIRAEILALLTPAQTLLLQSISAAIVQQSLIQDASCAYLTDAIPVVGNTVLQVNSSAGSLNATFFAVFPDQGLCGPSFPISIRNSLALTDSQVSGIIAIETGYSSLTSRRQTRTAEVEAEIRDETAKATLNAAALGSRYAELAALSQQLKQDDQDARATARSLLNSAQTSKLQAITAASLLERYLIPAETCNFINVPPGASQRDLSPPPCVLN